jgi:hypothetical protein
VFLITVVVTVPISGVVNAQGAAVDVQDRIHEDATEFDVEFSALGLNAVLVVENQATGETFERSLQVNGTLSVTVDEVGGISPGDEITATLYRDRVGGTVLASDSTRVTGFLGQFRKPTYATTRGETLEFVTSIRNPGDASGTQTVRLLVSRRNTLTVARASRLSQTVDSTELTLDSGDTREVVLTWNTSGWGAGVYTAVLADDDDRLDTARVNVTQPDPASFAVSIGSTSTPVLGGDSLDVTATITNTGDEAATQTVELAVDNRVVDETVVTLDGGESKVVTLTWPTDEADNGVHDATVVSEDSAASVDVTVLEPPYFSVDIEPRQTRVTAGETLVFRVTVTNTGEGTGTQDIDLSLGDTVVDVRELTLDGGETRVITLSGQTSLVDSGEQLATVESADDSNSTSVTVLRPADFRVSGDSTAASVTEGDPFHFTVSVVNTGDESATQEVVLEVDELEADSARLTLDAGDSRTVTLTWETGPADAGERHLAVVSTDDDTVSRPVTVTEPGSFDVELDPTPATVSPGERLSVRSTVTNTGDESATQEIRLEVDGTVTDSTEVTLDGGESTVVTFSWTVEEETAGGRHDVSVASFDDTASSPVVVESDRTSTQTEGGTGPDDTLFGLNLRELTEELEGVFVVGDESIVGGAGLVGVLVLLVLFRGRLSDLVDVLDPADDDGDDTEDPLNAVMIVAPDSPAPFQPVIFDGSLSSDPDPTDEVVDHSWRIETDESDEYDEADESAEHDAGSWRTGDDELTGTRVVCVFPTTGEKEVTLTVTNHQGEVGTAKKTVTVEEKAGELSLVQIHPDASEPAPGQAGLAGEFLVFANTGDDVLTLDGWTVHDADEVDGRVVSGEHTFEFSEGTELDPETRVTVHTGSEPADWDGPTDASREQHLFWGKSVSVWDPDGGILVVRDSETAPVLAKRYERRNGEYDIDDVARWDLTKWFGDLLEKKRR